MTNEQTEGSPGLPMPQKAFKFRVKIKEAGSLITQHVTDLKISYLDKTMTLNVFQPVSGEIHSVILNLCQYRRFVVIVEHLGDKNDSPVHTLTYTNCEVMDHAYQLSYENTSSAVHQLTIKFHDMTSEATR